MVQVIRMVEVRTTADQWLAAQLGETIAKHLLDSLEGATPTERANAIHEALEQQSKAYRGGQGNDPSERWTSTSLPERRPRNRLLRASTPDN